MVIFPLPRLFEERMRDFIFFFSSEVSFGNLSGARAAKPFGRPEKAALSSLQWYVNTWDFISVLGCETRSPESARDIAGVLQKSFT